MLKCNSEITGMMASEANKSYMLPDIYEPTVVHRDERKIEIKMFSKIFKNLIGNTIITNKNHKRE